MYSGMYMYMYLVSAYYMGERRGREEEREREYNVYGLGAE